MNYGAMFKKEITEIGNSLGLEGAFTEEFGFDQITAAISALKATPSREERLEEALVVAQSALDELATFGRGSYLSNNIADEARCKVAFILSPSPEYEEVEVVRWVCLVSEEGCGSTYREQDLSTTPADAVPCKCCGKTAFRMVGTIKREKPRKVQRRVTVSARVADASLQLEEKGEVFRAHSTKHMFGEHPECHGKTGTLTFTWEEQP